MPSNEGLQDTSTPAEAAAVSSAFVAGLHALVNLATAYSVPHVVGGVYANSNFLDFHTSTLFDTDDALRAAGWAQPYLPFLAPF